MATHAYRLPKHVRPRHYHVRLDADPGSSRFSGGVEIDVDVERAVEFIDLHARGLTLSAARLERGGGTRPLAVELLPAAQVARLSTGGAIEPGRARLHLEFAGELNPSMHGVYLASDGTTRAICTQCEATDARGIFPCFDEPEFKATLQFTLSTPPELIALANGPLAQVVDEPQGRRKVWRFLPTPPVSSYLAAFVIGDFEGTAASIVNDVPMRVYAPRGKLGQTSFALKTTERLLPWFEDYFAKKYAYHKYDQVAVPGFDAGAMENVGLVLFRQNLLLMDPATASWRQEKNIARIIAHEFAHMWFGNLVTMAWWDDLWLNEAFAEWMAHKAVDALVPSYHVWDDFQADKNRALADDALPTTHPIWTAVETPEEAIQMFDSITYQKGCAVMRMLENFIGAEAFRAGLRTYMERFAEKNAKGDDLWAELSAASGQPVARVMHEWISQSGFPKVVAELDGGELVVRQTRFYSARGAAATDETWSIPLVVRYADSGGDKEHRVLFSGREGRFRLPAEGEIRWCYPNASEIGFYRVQLGDSLRTRLLAEGLGHLRPAERMGLVEDHWALMRSGAIPVSQLLELVEAYARSGLAENHHVLGTIAERLAVVDHLLEDFGNRRARERFSAWLAELFGETLDRLGMAPKEGEDQNDRQRRPILIALLGRTAELPKVIAAAEAIAEVERRDAAAVDPNLAGVCLAIAARAGDRRRYQTWIETYRGRRDEGTAPQATVRYLSTLAEFKDSDLTASTLALIDDGSIPQESIGMLLAQVLYGRHGQALGWDYFQKNWGTLRARVGDMGLSRLVEALGALPADRRSEITDFFRANEPRGAERALARALAQMDQYAALLGAVGPDLVGWFGARV